MEVLAESAGLQARDQLLLCGGYLQLNQLQWLAPTTQSKVVSCQVVTLEAEDAVELMWFQIAIAARPL